jgi:autotransporter-associated beta strand protein
VLDLAGTTGGATIDATGGSGAITFTSAFTASGSGAKTLLLTGSSTADNTVKAVVNSGGGNTSLTKSGAGRWILSGTSTYTGATTVSQGTLLVNGSTASGSAVSVSSGATLGGNGTIHGATMINSGGTVAPGASIGTLHFDTAPTLSGTTAMEIDKTAGTNDQIVVNTGGGTLTYGGTLSITYLTGSAAVGDAYVLFVGASDASPKFSGSFSSITPSTPGTGAAWDTSTLATDGTLRVVCAAPALVNAGPDQTVCANSPAVTLAGWFGGAASSATWSGAGSFSNGDNTTTNATYTPSAGEVAAGAVTLTLTTDDPSGPCGPANDTMVITFDKVMATNVTYVRNAGSSLKISKTNLLTNASDTDSETISLVGVGTDGVNLLTTNGVILTTDANWIYYTNSVTPNAPDSFSYKVTDSRGCLGLGTVTVQVITNATSQGTTVVVSGNTATVGFAGIPGRSYQVQRSTNLVDWATLATTNAPAGGVFEWVDDFNDLGVPPADPPSSAYYRLRLP